MERVNITRSTKSGERVRAYSIIGTRQVVLSAWRRETALAGLLYHTFTHDDDGSKWGQVGTEFLPRHLDALPTRSTQRAAAVDAWQRERDEDALRMIRAAFPELADVATEDGGQMIVWHYEA